MQKNLQTSVKAKDVSENKIYPRECDNMRLYGL